ncbi:MAG: putative toxin-antitoxin system toxin component, PIN family [Firmicutes bacterium]|nr:putative toxin-antitoxin system toxin component, PIN family [Bacillota bacterium]
MKVIIDTNIVISAILRDRAPEEVILFVIQHPEFEWVASPEIIAEYIGVLRRPRFGLSKELLQKWQTIFEKVITIVEVGEAVNFPRDPKDAPFLACALATGAEYLITGDKDFTEAYKVVKTTVLSVSQFKTLVSSKWQ